MKFSDRACASRCELPFGHSRIPAYAVQARESIEVSSGKTARYVGMIPHSAAIESMALSINAGMIMNTLGRFLDTF